jgi:hypothetical protein
MSPALAVRELARWSDDKALDALVVAALRDHAKSICQLRSSSRDLIWQTA